MDFLVFTVAVPSLDLMFQLWGPKSGLVLDAPLSLCLGLCGFSRLEFPDPFHLVIVTQRPLPSIHLSTHFSIHHLHASIHPLPSIHSSMHSPNHPFIEPLLCSGHLQPTPVYSAISNHNFLKTP